MCLVKVEDRFLFFIENNFFTSFFSLKNYQKFIFQTHLHFPNKKFLIIVLQMESFTLGDKKKQTFAMLPEFEFVNHPIGPKLHQNYQTAEKFNSFFVSSIFFIEKKFVLKEFFLKRNGKSKLKWRNYEE